MEKKINPELQEEKKIERQIWNIIDENRVVQFSDAVFAFAATLLVLKIDIPELPKSQISSEFFHSIALLIPQYFANIISFLIIGYYWLNHHTIFAHLKRIDSVIVWINLSFLIFLSFIPFPVDLYGDFYDIPVIVAFYSLSLAIVGVCLSILWSYASYKHRLINKNVSDKQILYYTIRMWIAPIVFLISIPLIYFDLTVAQFSWIFVVLGIIVLNKIFHIKKMQKDEVAAL